MIDVKAMTKQLRERLRHMEELTTAVGAYLRQLDDVMKLPDSNERGRAIAKLSNALEIANDRVRYFGLGVDYRTDPKRDVAARYKQGSRTR